MAEDLTSDDDGVSQARYAAMRWNTPLAETHAELLLRRLEIQPSGSILDLGCGWGELLLRALAAPDGAATRGTGVDTDLPGLERARRVAVERGLEDRVRFVQGSAVDWREPADRVICVGASHAWGGSKAALAALRASVRPGGRLLFGDGFWKQEPSTSAVTIFGEEVVSLRDLVRLAHATGWEVVHLSEADQREWDDFESTWRLGRHRWLAEHPTDEHAPQLREELRSGVLEYLDAYRGVLGYGYLVLTR